MNLNQAIQIGRIADAIPYARQTVSFLLHDAKLEPE